MRSPEPSFTSTGETDRQVAHPRTRDACQKAGKMCAPPSARLHNPSRTMPQAAVSILRVSTKKQLNEGEGIENQRRANNEYIRRKGYAMTREIVIAESASLELKVRYDLE